MHFLFDSRVIADNAYEARFDRFEREQCHSCCRLPTNGEERDSNSVICRAE